jgi:hypothetical protein
MGIEPTTSRVRLLAHAIADGGHSLLEVAKVLIVRYESISGNLAVAREIAPAFRHWLPPSFHIGTAKDLRRLGKAGTKGLACFHKEGKTDGGADEAGRGCGAARRA